MTVRAELPASHDRVWQALANPGTKLNGHERVAIAQEARGARDCSLCKERKAALSPNVSGEHDRVVADMPRNRVELVHKLITDPGRITRAWVDELLASGMSDEEYIEIGGLVSLVTVVDTFHIGMGQPLRALPEPVAGEPSGRRPSTAVMEEAYVPMIPSDGLADDYLDLYGTSGFVANVQRAFSLVPEITRLANDLMICHYVPYEQVTHYTDADHSRSINKMQMELLAARVSMYNDCFY